MRTREIQMAQYKAEKEANATTATSFKMWLEMNKVDPVVEVEDLINQVNTAQVKVDEAIKTNKMALARTIFKEELDKATKAGTTLVRKEVMVRLKKEAQCTDHGANTYYQKLRDQFGLVEHK